MGGGAQERLAILMHMVEQILIKNLSKRHFLECSSNAIYPPRRLLGDPPTPLPLCSFSMEQGLTLLRR